MNGVGRIEDILDRVEAAEAVGLSINTMDYYRAVGKGPRFAKIGRRIFYRRADLEAWINEQFESTARGGAA